MIYYNGRLMAASVVTSCISVCAVTLSWDRYLLDCDFRNWFIHLGGGFTSSLDFFFN